MSIIMNDDRKLRSLTALTRKQFGILLETSTLIFETLRQQAYQEGVSAGTRRRRPGGGKKGVLPSMRDNLLFILCCFKAYPTFDVLEFNLIYPGPKRIEICTDSVRFCTNPLFDQGALTRPVLNNRPSRRSAPR